MQSERQRILQLVEKGTISAEEALVLLEALEKGQSAPKIETTIQEQTTQEDTQQERGTDEEPKQEGSQKKQTTGFEDLFGKTFKDPEAARKVNDFMGELKNDLSQFSTKMMDLMNTTFSKAKDFDFQFPFGEKVEFNKTFAFDGAEVTGVEIDVPNGKLVIKRADGEQVLVETHVKTNKSHETEDETIQAFTDGFVTLNGSKLVVTTSIKMASVDVTIAVPEKIYDVFVVRLLNGPVVVKEIDTKLLKIKTYNGPIRISEAAFQRGEFKSNNGMIEARFVKSEDLEAETMNGRIYIEGDVKEVEAESVNGAVTVTTTASDAHKIKGTTVAGTVEFYVPKDVSIDGEASTNFGKPDIHLPDVTVHSEQNQFLSKTVHFDKIEGGASVLKLVGESRTGAIIVRYNN